MKKRTPENKQAGGDDLPATQRPMIGDRAWMAEHRPYFESTGEEDFQAAGYDQEEQDRILLEQFHSQREALRRSEVRKCPYLWPKTPSKFRALSHIILEPIRQALRAKPLQRVIWHGNQRWRNGNKEAFDNKLTDDGMASLFGDGLAELKQNLGALLLNAVCTGDGKFKDVLASALKDADKLFHRGKLFDAFFDWEHTLPKGKLATMNRAEITEQFLAFSGRSELSSSEWERLKTEFVLDEIAEGKPGPKPKGRKQR